MNKYYKILALAVFAIAIGYMEAAIVVYLRELYYPLGFSFPLAVMTKEILKIEILREAATLIILGSISYLAGKTRASKLAVFLFLFATWDLTYYLFLKLLLGWPASLLTWDILFLIPTTWAGPVLAPMINSLTMLLLSWALLKRRNTLATIMKPFSWTLLVVGSLLIFYCYIEPFGSYLSLATKTGYPLHSLSSDRIIQLSATFVPSGFQWILFIIGVLLQLWSIGLILMPARSMKNSLPENKEHEKA